MQPQADPFIVPLCHEDIDIIYQDEHLLVINKPSGLLSLSGKHPLNLDSVHYRLVQDFPSATLLHRLDFGTSGLMIVALNKQVNGQLTKQFQNQLVDKTYIAILFGHVKDEEGLIDLPLAKDDFPLQKVCTSMGKKAQSYYRVLERIQSPITTRIMFKPLTGRTHQLRVHSSAIDHPILGCDLYAVDEAFFMAKRLMLHASEITFEHPVTFEKMTISSACPF